MSHEGPTYQKYVTPAKVMEIFDVSPAGLRGWAKEGHIIHIRKPGGGFLYDLNSIYTYFGLQNNNTGDSNQEMLQGIIYARVSSQKQKKSGDLQRQIQIFQNEYPEYKVIQNVGSGLNYKRKGLETILELVMQGLVRRIVVTHKDRLCRYGSELLELIFKKFNTQLVVHRKDDDFHGYEEELSDDILAIVNFFSAKHNGLRAAKNRKLRKQQEQQSHESMENTNVSE